MHSTTREDQRMAPTGNVQAGSFPPVHLSVDWALRRRRKPEAPQAVLLSAECVLTDAWVRSRLIRRARHFARRAQDVTELDRLWRLLCEFSKFLASRLRSWWSDSSRSAPR